MITPYTIHLTLFLKRLIAATGPGYLIAVGYMDPGNWATDIAGGARYGYALLSVILISNCMAMVLQFCAIKLGIATGKDLARACRDYYHPWIATLLWILAELAVIATDLAEVIGSAIGLNLLLGIPLVWGVCITAGDVLLLLLCAGNQKKIVEYFVALLISGIIICFAIIITLCNPHFGAVMKGFVPTRSLLYDPEMLYLAIGILGATVMPHNLYLHSALVKEKSGGSITHTKNAIFYAGIDSTLSLTFAFFVNAAILIVAAAVFFERGFYGVAEIQDAYHLFTPLLSTPVASFVFALALLMSGQNSTLTGTLAGQIILEGFTAIRLPAWVRRLLGRCITIIPALIAIIWWGHECLGTMMIVSQVILSLQLPFAVFPLVQFTGNKKIMGIFTNGTLLKVTACGIALSIAIANMVLLFFLIA